jgi:tetratricopeptide (TPR) repeat protein
MHVRMQPGSTQRRGPGEGLPSPRIVLILLVAMVAVILIGILLKKREPVESVGLNPTGSVGVAMVSHSREAVRVGGASSHSSTAFASRQTPQEIVAGKVMKFGKNRRELAHAMAKRLNVKVPDEVERFFDAVEGGRWDEIEAAHKALLEDEKQLNQPKSAELHEFWRPIQETWGAAREAQNWPAQRLLDYGNAILDSLRPRMIYAGGTDPGCFIPTMMNETGDGDKHIVLTQNALADGTYLKYLDVLYGDQMATLTQDDSQRAFQDYLADAQKRLQHDQQFPNEPAQLKPGEDVKVVDGKVQVSGQVAVMAINEKLFQMLMDKNPDALFAMEESFPFKSMYGAASPLGPVIEMGPPQQQSDLNATQAAQSVDYWQTAAQQLLSDPETPEGSDARKAYSKLISSQAGLLADHGLPAEAEQEFRIALQLTPESPEAVFRYINLLLSQSRVADALPIVENAIKAAPDNEQLQGLRNNLNDLKKSQGR